MTYKNSIERFQSLIRRYSLEGKTAKKATNADIMAELSLTAMEWGNKYRLNEVEGNIDLVAGQSKYALPIDLYDITYFGKATRVGKPQIDEAGKCGGVKYTVYGTDDDRVLEINFIPENSYDPVNYPEGRIGVIYTRKFEMFEGAVGIYSDYDETANGYGGSWKIPEAYHGFMVEYAAANYCGEVNKMLYWEQKAKELYAERPVYVKTKLPYYMGVGN